MGQAGDKQIICYTLAAHAEISLFSPNEGKSCRSNMEVHDDDDDNNDDNNNDNNSARQTMNYYVICRRVRVTTVVVDTQ